jgi:hypothetical protein
MGRSLSMPKYEVAMKLYYGTTELNNTNIKELFGGICSESIVKLKKKVKRVMIERGVQTWQPNNINTKIAFEVWNLDVEEMEKNYNKLKKLGLMN